MRTSAGTRTTRPETGGPEGALVDAEWLEAHLSDPHVRVVEVDVSAAAYSDWHVEGAVLWNVYSDLKDADYHPAATTALQELIDRSGIESNSTVVFYGYAPALAVWLMTLHGHPDVRILDCSRDTWRAGRRPISGVASRPAAGSFRLRDEDRRIRADRTTVLDAIDDQGSTLLDVRSEAEYFGERFWPSGGMEPGGRAGHVPSAVHQPIDGLYDEAGSFLPAAQLRRVFSSVDLDGDDELITYCTIGGRAATAWFVLTHLLGRDSVRVYDGSWAEWGRTPWTPVACP